MLTEPDVEQAYFDLVVHVMQDHRDTGIVPHALTHGAWWVHMITRRAAYIWRIITNPTESRLVDVQDFVSGCGFLGFPCLAVLISSPISGWCETETQGDGDARRLVSWLLRFGRYRVKMSRCMRSIISCWDLIFCAWALIRGEPESIEIRWKTLPPMHVDDGQHTREITRARLVDVP